jgi:hypothetical protein
MSGPTLTLAIERRASLTLISLPFDFTTTNTNGPPKQYLQPPETRTEIHAGNHRLAR